MKKKYVYYNEFDEKTAKWLEQLILDKNLPSGVVDTRSIVDVQPEDLKEFHSCHFFAGIGGWPLALRLAGVPDDFPIWSGSCPCQPFSTAGLRKGFSDERNLWPEFYRLIKNRKPPVVFGEQVAPKIGLEWLSGVRLNLEESGYAVGAANLCAAGVGAPHIRQRLFWVANSKVCHESYQCSISNKLLQESQSVASRIRNASVSSKTRHCSNAKENKKGKTKQENFWSNYGTVRCADKRNRRFEPSICPLADGLSTGMAYELHGYGNAIVPQVAAEFIKAFFEVKEDENNQKA